MAEYIDRELLLETIHQNPAENGNQRVAQLLHYILNAPVADVEPVKHGVWLAGELDFCVCSVCGNEIPEHAISPYCDECGAKMDGEG